MKHANRLAQVIEQSRQQVLAPLLLSPPSASQSQNVVKAYLSSQSGLYRLIAETIRQMMPSHQEQKHGEKEALLNSLGDAWEVLDRIVSLLHQRNTLKLNSVLSVGSPTDRSSGNNLHHQTGASQQLQGISTEIQLEINKTNRRILDLLSSNKDFDTSLQDESDQALMCLIGHEPKETKIYFDEVHRPTEYTRNPIEDYRLNLDAQVLALNKQNGHSQKKSATKSKPTSGLKSKEEGAKYVLRNASEQPNFPELSTRLFKSTQQPEIRQSISHYTFLGNSKVEEQLKRPEDPSPFKDNIQDDPFRLKKSPFKKCLLEEAITADDCFKLYKQPSQVLPESPMLPEATKVGIPFEKLKLCLILDILQRRFKRTFVRRAKSAYIVTLKSLQEELEIQKQRNEMLMNMLGTKKLQGRESAETSLPISELSKCAGDKVSSRRGPVGEAVVNESKEPIQNNYLKIKPANNIVIVEAGQMDSVLTDNHPSSPSELVANQPSCSPNCRALRPVSKSVGNRCDGLKKSTSANLDFESQFCDSGMMSERPSKLVRTSNCLRREELTTMTRGHKLGDSSDRQLLELSGIGTNVSRNIFQTNIVSSPSMAKLQPRKQPTWSSGVMELCAAPTLSELMKRRQTKRSSQFHGGPKFIETSLVGNNNRVSKEFLEADRPLGSLFQSGPLQTAEANRYTFRNLCSSLPRHDWELDLPSRPEDRRTNMQLGQSLFGLQSSLTKPKSALWGVGLLDSLPLDTKGTFQPQKSAVPPAKLESSYNPPVLGDLLGGNTLTSKVSTKTREGTGVSKSGNNSVPSKVVEDLSERVGKWPSSPGTQSMRKKEKSSLLGSSNKENEGGSSRTPGKVQGRTGLPASRGVSSAKRPRVKEDSAPKAKKLPL